MKPYKSVFTEDNQEKFQVSEITKNKVKHRDVLKVAKQMWPYGDYQTVADIVKYTMEDINFGKNPKEAIRKAVRIVNPYSNNPDINTCSDFAKEIMKNMYGVKFNEAI